MSPAMLDRSRLLRHIIAAKADALAYQEAGLPALARVRRNDEVALRARLRGLSEGGTHVA